MLLTPSQHFLAAAIPLRIITTANITMKKGNKFIFGLPPEQKLTTGKASGRERPTYVCAKVENTFAAALYGNEC